MGVFVGCCSQLYSALYGVALSKVRNIIQLHITHMRNKTYYKKATPVILLPNKREESML